MGARTLYSRALKLMGNRFEISVLSEDETHALACIDAGIEEIRRIERLLTTFADSSETNLINRNAGISPVPVSEETFRLIERSLRISGVTQGAFDITYGSVDKSLWNFDTQMKKLPDRETAQKMVRLINYRNVLLDPENKTVFLKEKGMRIGFGGIGKGYAAERAKKVMQDMGAMSGVVNASGDLATWGYQVNGQPWTIGIVNPASTHEIFSYLNITGLAVATSGNYEKYVMIEGKRYSHTIDPRTGLPVAGIKSVTIISTNAEIADAMATPVMIMGVHAGLYMINQVNDMEAIIIDDLDQLYHSSNIHFK